MRWWDPNWLPSIELYKVDLLRSELDHAAKRDGYLDFDAKLTETIAERFRDRRAAASWAKTIRENAVGYLSRHFILKAIKTKITLARRPRIPVATSLERLGCIERNWLKTWLQLPNEATYLLQVAEAHTNIEMQPWLNHFPLGVSFPIREAVLPLIAPAKALASVLLTNSKHDRDELFGSMLRMWRSRHFIDSPVNPTISVRPQHDEAWRLISRIESCFASYFHQYDFGDSFKILDIPIQRAKRESIYERSVHWKNWPAPKVDTAARIDQALALQRWLTPPVKSTFPAAGAPAAIRFPHSRIITDLI